MRNLFKGTVTVAGYLLLLYVAPTLVERVLLSHFGPWVACILFGDLVGCVVLFAVFRMRRSAVMLYVGLGLIDASLLKEHLVSLEALPWITDLVPALVAGFTCALAGVYLLRNRSREDFFSDEFQEY